MHNSGINNGSVGVRYYTQWSEHTGGSSSSSTQNKGQSVAVIHSQSLFIPKGNESTRIVTKDFQNQRRALSFSDMQFNDLTSRQRLEGLVRAMNELGDGYDGKFQSYYAVCIREVARASHQSLTDEQLNRLVPFLECIKPTDRWSWRSLTTVLYSLTSAGAFISRKRSSENLKSFQTSCLTALLHFIEMKCDDKTDVTAIAGGITNVLCALARLVKYKTLPKNSELVKQCVVALLPRIIECAGLTSSASHFNSHETSNAVSFLVRLRNKDLELEPLFKNALAVLCSDVKRKAGSKDHSNQFSIGDAANLMLSLGELVDLKFCSDKDMKITVAALLFNIQTKIKNPKEAKDCSPQFMAHITRGMGKLAGRQLGLTTFISETAEFIWPHALALTKSDSFFSIKILSDQISGMASLLANGVDCTTSFKVVAQVWLKIAMSTIEATAYTDDFKVSILSNLLWGTAQMTNVVFSNNYLLHQVVDASWHKVARNACLNRAEEQFVPQEIDKLTSALVMLINKEFVYTVSMNDAMSNMLRLISKIEVYDQFSLNCVVNVLRGITKLGEAVPIDDALFAFKCFLERVDQKEQLSADQKYSILWGLMVFDARRFLNEKAIANKEPWLMKSIDALYADLKSVAIKKGMKTEQEKTLEMAKSWLKKTSAIEVCSSEKWSPMQAELVDSLRWSFSQLRVKNIKIYNSLSSVDVVLPDHNVVLEIVDPSLCVDSKCQIKKGSSLLKKALIFKQGFEIIEIPVSRMRSYLSKENVVQEIKEKLALTDGGQRSTRKRTLVGAYNTAPVATKKMKPM